jgi:amino acid adenylation domain-containing protein/non-ribosomal peptide synthase protein (TIGR01720 family)
MKNLTTHGERRPENVETMAALTPMQQGILFHALGAKERDPYFQQLVFALRGELNPELLEQAWQAVVNRHQVLRADYRWEETATPLQVIFKSRSVSLRRSDWSDASDSTQQRRLVALLLEERRVGYDFRKASDARLQLIRTGEAAHWLIWSHHHVTLDGWSTALVLGDVLNAYHALSEGSLQPTWPGRAFGDYLGWLSKRDRASAMAYWQRRLSGLEIKTPLPVSPGLRERAYAETALQLTPEASNGLRQRCRELGVTLNTLVQAGWALLLARHAGVEEVVFGATVSGRPDELAGIESSIGLFINTLPIRVRLDPSLVVRAWLRNIQDQNQESRDQGHLALADIRRAAGRSGEDALFDSVVVFENFPVDEVLRRQPSGLSVEFLPLQRIGNLAERSTTGRNNYPLTLNVVPGACLTLTLAYESECFEAQAIGALAEQLKGLLFALCEHAERPLGNLGLPLEAASIAQPPPMRDLDGAAHTPGPLVLDLFGARAREQGSRLAVRDERRALDYQELDIASNRIAHGLIKAGVEREDRIGLCAERGTELVVGLLGILKAGAAYVPLDPSLPVARISELCSESGATLILATRAAEAFALQCGRHVVTSDSWASGPADAAPPERQVFPEQLAYLIFTSGSTGRPKGVAVSHGALAKYVSGLLERLQLETRAAMALVSTIGADLGHTVLFGALCAGSCLHIIERERAFDPDRFAEYMHRHGVGVLKIVPSHFRALLHARQAARVLPAQALILGGEASDWSLVEKVKELNPSCRVFNHYGPTETTVGVSLHECQARTDGANVPMGQPLPGAELYVLDRHLNRVPSGVTGELYIGGERLARGYWGRAGLTADRFVPSPFSLGGRLYRTGDRVRRRLDGDFEFLGRFDRQVKIRGYRVELGEVEARLMQYDGVSRAVVLARASADGGMRLLGYAVPAPGARLSEEALSEHLKQVLPDYMLPQRISITSELPLTDNGKLNLSALEHEQPAEVREHVPPTTEVEKLLVQVWREVLKVEHLGVSDDFFALGGDSILSLQLVARARRRGLRLSPQQIFENRTIRELSRVIALPQPEAPAQAPERAQGEVPLLPMQSWFFQQELREPQRYTQSLLLRVKGALDAARLEQALAYVLHHHDALRLTYQRDEHGRWQQRYLEREASSNEPSLLQVHVARSESELGPIVEALHARLDLGQGLLFQAALIDAGGGVQRLLLVAHHLVVDGVSWRVLIEDLHTAYLRSSQGVAVELPAKTSSLRQWAEELQVYAGSEAVKRQLEYWVAQLGPARVSDPHRDNPAGKNLVKYSANASLRLDPSQTEQLLRQVPRACGAQINDVLLAALSRVLCRFDEATSILLQLEGHGREVLSGRADLSRTVGWLTSVYPVRLTPVLGGLDAVRASVRAIQAQLAAVPDRGLAYGLLRYSSPEGVRSAFAGLGVPRVTFNYLGQFDQTLSGSELFEALQGSGGLGQSSDAPLGNWLTFNGHVYDGELKLTCNYSSDMYEAGSIQRLVEDYHSELLALIDSVPSGAAEQGPV